MKRWILGAFWAAMLAALVEAASATGAVSGNPIWVGSWASSQMVMDGQNAFDPALMRDATLRQIVRLSLGGVTLRVRLSNAFGTAPLTVTAVHVARAVASGRAAIVASTDRKVTFDGHDDVVIPPGAEYISDPVTMAVPARADLAISVRFAEPPTVQTGHPGSRATSFWVAGDHVADADLPGATRVDHWYTISAVDVAPVKKAGAVAILGDSITDGRGSTTNGDDRWPDALSERLIAAGKTVGILNFGIGGNRVLNDGLGPNALARFDRDVLAQNGVKTLIVFEGVNDLGTLTLKVPVSAEAHAALVDRLIGAYKQIIQRAHAHGMKVLGGTIMPYGGSEYYHPTAENEADRQALNAWIRAKGHFDAVIDFDAAVRDPGFPDRLKAAYDSGDHLHPNPAGYRAMAAAMPLSLFASR